VGLEFVAKDHDQGKYLVIPGWRLVKETPKRSAMVILRLASSDFINRFAHGISDAKRHALAPNRGGKPYHCRASRQMDRHPPAPQSRTREEHSTKGIGGPIVYFPAGTCDQMTESKKSGRHRSN
jgi:hypothetical protein